jgi:hypothetical protein
LFSRNIFLQIHAQLAREKKKEGKGRKVKN